MPVSGSHCFKYAMDELKRYAVLKKIAHRVHENQLGRLPPQRNLQRMFMECQCKAIAVVLLAHCFQTKRKPLGVAALTAWANLRAAGQRIPCCLGPFDTRIFSHFVLPMVFEM